LGFNKYDNSETIIDFPANGTDYYDLNISNEGLEKFSFNEDWFKKLLNVTYASHLKELNILNHAVSNPSHFIDSLGDTEKEAIVKVRTKQTEFKNKLLIANTPECKICGLNIPKLLIASHIKPWSASKQNPTERLDHYNGFLLCPTHDALFDKNLITFNDNGSMIISKQIPVSEYDNLNISEEICIEISPESLAYLKYHQGEFKG
jgi:predicted restriction endonuclease